MQTPYLNSTTVLFDKVVKQRSSPTPADIIVDIQSHITYVGIKCLLVRISAGVRNLSCFTTFFVDDPYLLK